MSLGYREQRQLRGIEAGLFRSDSHLAGMLETFGRLYRGPDTPASERALPGQGRDQGAVTRIAVAFAVAALALSACSTRRSPRQLGPARPRPATGRPA